MLWWDVSYCLCSVVHLTDPFCITHASSSIYLRFASKQKSPLILHTRLWWSPKIIDSARPRQPSCLWAPTKGQGERWKSIFAAMIFTMWMRCKSLSPIFQMPLERTKSWIVIMPHDDQRRYRRGLCTRQHTEVIVTACVVYRTMSFHQWNKRC